MGDELLGPLLRYALGAQKEQAADDTLVRKFPPGREGLRVPDSAGNVPGGLVRLGFEESLALIEADLLLGIRAADGYPLCDACVPNVGLVATFSSVLGNEGQRDTWDEIMCRRIGDTWRSRNPTLVWLDDKVDQVRLTTEICGRELHLPIYGDARRGDADAERALRERVCQSAARQEPVVVKPRHGANSRHVFLWPEPRQEDVLAMTDSVDQCLHSYDSTWDRECWQLSQVPKGALAQPLYAIGVPKRPENGPRSRQAPLELKVQVLFGEVVGGTLNTHPQVLWVTRQGGVKMWALADLQACGHTGCRNLDRHYGARPPDDAVETLRSVLQEDWAMICGMSERLTREAGLDELRVDWLLGDPRWGSRIGELTYMGAGSRLTPALSARLARAYAAAHLCRLGALRLEPGDPESEDDACALWPEATLRPREELPSTRKKRRDAALTSAAAAP